MGIGILLYYVWISTYKRVLPGQMIEVCQGPVTIINFDSVSPRQGPNIPIDKYKAND